MQKDVRRLALHSHDLGRNRGPVRVLAPDPGRHVDGREFGQEGRERSVPDEAAGKLLPVAQQPQRRNVGPEPGRMQECR